MCECQQQVTSVRSLCRHPCAGGVYWHGMLPCNMCSQFRTDLNFLSSASTVWMYIMLIWSAVFCCRASACDSRLQRSKLWSEVTVTVTHQHYMCITVTEQSTAAHLLDDVHKVLCSAVELGSRHLHNLPNSCVSMLLKRCVPHCHPPPSPMA